MSWLLPVVLAVTMAVEAPAPTSCNIQSSSPPGKWRFIRVVDARTGEIVFGQAINGGDAKYVTVKHRQVNIQQKLPGGTTYRTTLSADCHKGVTIRI